MEKGEVELGGHAPHRAPFALGQKLGLGERPRHPTVQDRLRPAGEHLETDHHVGALRMQRGEGLQLPAMMIHVVVLLTEQHDRTLGHRGDQPGALDCLRRCALQARPATGGEAGSRRVLGVRRWRDGGNKAAHERQGAGK